MDYALHMQNKFIIYQNYIIQAMNNLTIHRFEDNTCKIT